MKLEDYGDYASETQLYLREMEMEEKRMPRADYLKTVQTEVTASMREYLVDWMVIMAYELQFEPDTVYRAVSYIDRFLSFSSITEKQMQLLGMSSMLIASKYGHITHVTASQWSSFTDWACSTREVVNLEGDILKILEYEVGNPTAKTFLRRFIVVAREDVTYSKLRLEFLANYLAELTLLDYGCISFLPSIVAASAVFLARFTIEPKRRPWSKQLEKFTKYAASDLKDCVTAMHDLQLNKKEFSLVNIRKKYMDHTFKCVSSLRSPQEIPALYFDHPKEEEEAEEEEEEEEEEEGEEYEEEDEEEEEAEEEEEEEEEYEEDEEEDEEEEGEEYEEYEEEEDEEEEGEEYEEEEEEEEEDEEEEEEIINLPPSKKQSGD